MNIKNEQNSFHIWLVLLFVLCTFQIVFISLSTSSKELLQALENKQFISELPLYTKIVMSPLFRWGSVALGLVLLFLCVYQWRSSAAAARSSALMLVISCLVLVGVNDPIKEIGLPQSNRPAELTLGLKLKNSNIIGYQVMRVLPLSRLEERDLRAGDVITAIDGQMPENSHQAYQRFAKGNTLQLTIQRDGKEEVLSIPKRR